LGHPSKQVWNHLAHPRHVGALADADAVGREGTRGQGPFMEIYVKLAGDRIDKIGFKTYGCGYSIAASSCITDLVAGETVQAAGAVTPETLEQALGGLPLGKRHVTRMAVSALRKALAQASGSG